MNLPEADVLEGLLGALLCATIGSVFATLDAALSALNPGRLSALHEEAKGLPRASLQRYIDNPSSQHSRWLVGRVVFTALAAVLVANALAPYVPRWSMAPLGALGALLTYGTCAEIGTTLARSRADYFAMRVFPIARPLELLVIPFALPLSFLGRRASRLLGPDAPPDARQTETEVQWVIAEGQKHGGLGQEPAEMLRNVLELKDLIARDVMVPRTRMCAIAADTPLPEVLRLVASEGHSRYPVYRDQVDNVIGLLYAKDLFRLLKDEKLPSMPLADLVRAPVNFVPEMQGVSSVLREMRARRLHMAIVIDEFGGVSGIVTLEDIIEVIVGEIRDEYDTEEAPIQDLGDGRLLADAAVSVHDLSAYLGAEIPEDRDYESLAGLIIHRAGKVPSVGAHLEAFGLSFVVREADEKRIAKVEIVRPRPLSEPAPAASDNEATSSGKMRRASSSKIPSESPSGKIPSEAPAKIPSDAPSKIPSDAPPDDPTKKSDPDRKIASAAT
ncbi:MAG TPA: hemolysin family protein [Polyangiaceae bacterium]|nr:hemolysin family protein [Polyangiaceae bacterium]